MPKIYLIDVTNRDGVQTSRIGLAKLEKTILNLFLNEMGVYQSELGFPFTNHEVNYINANLELAETGVLKPIVLSGWVRAVKEDIELALKLTKIKNLNISASVSDIMIKGKFRGKVNRRDVIKNMTEAADYAKENGIISLGVNAEDASRADLDFMIEFAAAAKEHGADRIRYCDTLGFDDPFTVYERIKKLAHTTQLPIELHCHNDLGMAVACSVAGAKAAVEAGVDAYINTCVNGIGERAGNADLASVILAVRKSSGFYQQNLLDERIDLSHCWRIGKYAAYAFGLPVSINQVAIGDNAFAHESGIHADGALKDAHNYELYDYRELGRGEPEIVETGRQITTGEYGGIKGFRNVYEKLEIAFKDEKEAVKILELVRYANVHTQKPLTDYELRFIAKYPDIARKIMTVTP
ncbi:MAG: homocitrate synthase [Candidatus Schekmanbacteria bacterium]|nr:homocitrate synthase [Candidatus Schekmanbacteria bacterium]